MRKEEAIDYILKRLDSELSADYSYHSVSHTKEVMQNVTLLSGREGLMQHELDILHVAAAYHDCGFLIGPDQHELKGCEIVRRVLPSFDFDKPDIETICNLIMATKIPQVVQTRLAGILCDADLMYLVGSNYSEVAGRLKQELFLLGHELDNRQWIDMQMAFLEKHQFWTSSLKTIEVSGKELVLSELAAQRNLLDP